MARPIKDADEALKVATRLIDAQKRLLVAYRIGTTRPPASAIDTISEQMPRFEAWTEANK